MEIPVNTRVGSMTSPRQILLVLIASLTLFGCASTQMAAIPDSQDLITPPLGKAVVVFMRPSFFASAIRSSVFDVSVEPPVLVGIVSAKKKVAYTTDLGARRFMVIGESADFMDATLLAGKTYYAYITPRMGWWKARFSLEPVAKAETEKELTKDLASSSWVANTADSLEWAQTHLPSIQAKENEYLQPWLAKSERPTLNPDDGR
jgi:hypothetical protein